MSTGESLGDRFKSQPNALNFLRLCLALEVIVWHSYALRGGAWLPTKVEAFLGDIAVDSFFAISGFLICRAWTRRPDLGHFLVARARRILPGLWVCLSATAFVIAPVTMVLTGGDVPTLGEQVRYVVGNASTWVTSYDVGGGPVGVPVAGAWNGSLWSLQYEALCYLAVAALGVLRVLNGRIIGALAGFFWLWCAFLTAHGITGGALIVVLPRTGFMFCCGALLWCHRDRIAVNRWLALAAAAVVAFGTVTHVGRVVDGPAIAYLCLYLGLTLGRHRRLVLGTDLSYGAYIYAFPIQQALLVCGVTLGWLGFASVSIVAALPVAALSWFLVEQPLLRRKVSSSRAAGIPTVDLAAVGTAA